MRVCVTVFVFLPNQACWSPCTSIASPKSASFTAAPFILLANNKFSGWDTHTHTHTLWELLGCLNLTDWGYRDELFIFVRALRTWYTPTNNSLIPTFKSPPKAQRLKASSRDSLWTLDRQHIRPRPKPLGVIKSRRVKVARGQPVILVTITAPCTLH